MQSTDVLCAVRRHVPPAPQAENAHEKSNSKSNDCRHLSLIAYAHCGDLVGLGNFLADRYQAAVATESWRCDAGAAAKTKENRHDAHADTQGNGKQIGS